MSKSKKDLEEENAKLKQCIDLYIDDDVRDMGIDELYKKLRKQKMRNNKLCCICYILATGFLCAAFYVLGIAK